MKLRINAGHKSTSPPPQDKAIAEAYRNKFIIPLDFEMLDSAMPYYQAGLRTVLSYELKFNNHNRVIKSPKNQHSQIPVNKSDTKWNWSFNKTCKSLKGILVLFEEEQPFAQDTSRYYNPKIQKVSVTVEGKPNQLYSQGMRSFEQYDEAHKYFAEGRLAKMRPRHNCSHMM